MAKFLDKAMLTLGICRPKGALELLTRHANSSGDIPLNVRVSAAVYSSGSVWHNTPQLVRMILSPRPIGYETASAIVEGVKTIVHGAFRAIAQCATYELLSLGGETYFDVEYWESTPSADTKNHRWEKMRFEWRLWRALLAELLEADADLHTINSFGKPPLLEAFQEVSKSLAIRDRTYLFNRWLRDIRDAGVDLLRFGYSEARLITLELRNKDAHCSMGDAFDVDYHLIGSRGV